MRQAGIVAAAGIVALEEMIDRLAEDHIVAQYLALGLAQIPGLRLAPGEVKTNIVFFELDDTVEKSAEDVARVVQENSGILVGTSGKRSFRAVTHHWVGQSDADRLLECLRETLSA
jgi:threonine aldolase